MPAKRGICIHAPAPAQSTLDLSNGIIGCIYFLADRWMPWENARDRVSQIRAPQDSLDDDQATSASWWSTGTATPFRESSSSVFSSSHGLVQTHPSDHFNSFASSSSSSGSSNPFAQSSIGPLSGDVRSRPLPPASSAGNGKLSLKHLDFTSSATAELRRNPALSAPDECARACRENEPPRICYYHFTLELYTVLGA
ncbi:hypothetical protein EVAR_31873_1 [Eumeta japonica]|uniref:Uncharacterized protein n=1 Tax=Eumeta variegata TaxID=151549 RepID=A0A4C1WWR9_EUMVA|nr:hypothetical protein EVAR_31873_1 [Eumeta japonica]